MPSVTYSPWLSRSRFFLLLRCLGEQRKVVRRWLRRWPHRRNQPAPGLGPQPEFRIWVEVRLPWETDSETSSNVSVDSTGTNDTDEPDESELDESEPDDEAVWTLYQLPFGRPMAG